MKFNATITTVSDKTRQWDGPQGPISFISGTFDDGSGWSIGCKPENVAKRIDDMKELIGQPGEYECDEGKEYQGQKQWKIKNYPGKPQPGGGGGFRGGGGAGQSYKYSEQGAKEERDSIHRSVALTQAVLACKDGAPSSVDDILRYADSFYAWLSKGSHAPVQKTFDQLKNEPGLTTADKLISKGSVLEATLEQIEKYTRIKELAACSDYILQQTKSGVLEKHEQKKLDVLSAKRSIAIATAAEDEAAFAASEQFIRALYKDGRLNDTEYGKLCNEHAEAATLDQGKRRF